MSGGPPQERIDDLTPEERRALLQRLLREKQRRGSAQQRPVSFAQRRLWFLDQLAEDGTLYNTPVALRLSGDLDVDVLHRALDEIVARHETLRTTFAERDGEPVQVVAPPGPLELDRLDLSAEPDPEPALRRTARDLGGRPFDLARGPLLRARLVKLPEQEHVLLMAVHHIVYDGWSNDIVVRELSTLYDAFAAGRPSPLPTLPIQYGDYAAWQSEHLTGDVLERLLTSGLGRLSGAPNLELPTDHPRPPVQQLQAAKLHIDLPERVAKSLETISRAQGATLFMTALATLKVLLLRITGQEDLVVGTPIAGRNRSETEGVVGCFVNTVVLRNDLSGDPTFRELVTRVRDTSLEAFDHGELPFERLVEELKPDRDLSRNPVFQMLFMLQEAGAGMWGGAKQQAEAADGLRIRPFELDSGATRLDLEAYMFRTPDGIRVLFNYSTALFEPDTVRNMLRWFARLLEGIADDADRPISTLPLMDEAERAQVLTRWNDTALPLPPVANITQIVAAQVERTPDAPAATFGDETLTYRELKARSSALASQLSGMGLTPGDRVGLHLERGLPMLVALLGVLESGAAYVPLDPGFPAERLRYMAEDAGLAVVLTNAVLTNSPEESDFADIVPRVETLDARGAIERTPGSPADAPAVAAPAPAESGPDDLAYILYTSGSTGRPKGVRIPHSAAMNLLFAMAREPGMQAQDVLVAVTTLSFDISFLELVLPLTVGAQVVIADREEASDAERLAALLEKADATVLQATPATFRMLLATGWTGRPDLTVWLGGEAWGMDLARPLLEGCKAAWNGYGPTEATVYSGVRRVRDDDTHILVGGPIPNTTAYVLDPAGEPVPTGVAGELYIGGAGVAQGYHGRPDLTEERFVPDPFGTRDGGRLYRTGDRARQLSDGSLQFLGRLDAQVKLRGYRIELGEIESVLGEQPGVEEAAATVREDRPGEPHLVAYVVSEAAPDPGALRAALRERLPEYMVPGVFVALDTMPHTPSGKLDRKALPAPDATDMQRTTAYEPPRGIVEELLAELWADVLHVEQVGAHDNFFELGGHSLLATRVVSRIRDAFGVELPLAEVFSSATLSALAERIAELRRVDVPSLPKLVARPPGTEPRPSLQQVRLWFLDQLEPGSGAYNMPLARRLLGPLDVDALQQGLTTIVGRHEVLHTVFEEDDGEARVRLVQPAAIEVPVEDLSQLSEADLDDTIRDRVQAQTQQPFDLTTGPLLRARLLRLGPETHVFLLTMHHIVSDGLSLDVVFSELAEVYTAVAESREPSLPDLPLQYTDYACWQRECFESDLMERELSWWRDTLRDAPPTIELPCDHPRPDSLSSLGARETTTLDENTVRMLHRLGQGEGASLFMVLLAAFKVLLMRTTGTTDIVVGTPVSGRTHTEMEPLVGFFINTLVLRNDLSGAPSFRELVRRVRQGTLDAFTHQQIPFEKLVEELQPRRDPGRNPIFQVFVNMLDVSESGGLALPDLQVEPVGGLSEHSKFDITLYLFVRGDQVSCALAYNVDLFEPATVRSLLGKFNVLLEGIAADAEQPVTRLPLHSEEERLQLAAMRGPDLVQQGFTPFTEGQVEQSVGQRFATQVARAPERVAIRTESRSWTYADLDARSRSIGATLSGVIRNAAPGAAGADGQPTQRVIVLVEHGELALASALGILRAGCAYVPLDPGYPEPWLRDVIADTRPAAVLTDTAHLDLARSLAASAGKEPAPVLDVEGPLAVADVEPDAGADFSIDGPISPDALAYIRYTSGSTGRPKGVMQSHRGLLAHIRAYTNSLHIDAADRLSGLASFTHDAGLMDAYGAVLNGASWCPWPLRQRSPAEAVDALDSLGITIYHSTPSAFRYLFQTMPTERTLPSARLVVFGGEAPRISDLTLYRQHFHEGCLAVNGLGSSESSQTLQAFFDHATPLDRPRVPVGQPIDGTEVVLLDAEGRETDVLGELGVRSDHIALGYWERPEETAAVFSPEPAGRGSARLYRSGDLARRLPDGRLEWLGRLDDQVEIRGYRVEPGEVAAALAALPGVGQAVVVPRETPAGEPGLVGYVVLGADAPEPAALLQEVRSRLPEHMHPALLVPLDALPKTAGGKLDKRALPDPEWGEVQRTHAYRAPTTASEQRLAEIFAEVLGVGRVGADDHFFELGGHSLLATRIVSRVRDALRVELPLADIFAEPRLAGLAARIDALLEGEPTSATPPLVVDDRPETPEPSFQQLRVWFLDRLDPGSGAYNMPLARSLRGALDVDALRTGLDTLVARHETLRSSFPEQDGQPQLRIAGSLSLEAPLIDLSALAPAEREAALSSHIKADAQEPFDLAQGPLIRASLLKLADEEHVLLLCIHHIVCDAGSMELFFRELAACYAATLEQRQPELPALAVQYADYAHWQHRCLQGHVLDDQLAWWRETLGEGVNPLELPLDRPRPEIQRSVGARETVEVDEQTVRALRRLGQEESASLFMVLLAAFKTLLMRTTGSTDVVVGTPVSGRTHTEVEPLVGFFINTLVLRNDLSGAPSFRELVRGVRQSTLDAFAHQDIPFEKLVEELKPRRDLSRNPLFDVFVNMVELSDSKGFELPGLTSEPVGETREHAKFDITLYLLVRGDALWVRMAYNTDLFERSTVLGLLDRFNRLLEGAAKDADQPLAALPLLAADERARLAAARGPDLVTHDAPAFEAGQTQQSIPQRFARQVAHAPGAAAVGAEGFTWTYASLDRRSEAAAQAVLRAVAATPDGIAEPQRVVLLVESGAHALAGALGVLRAGHAYVPLDPSYPEAWLRDVMQDTRPAAVLTDHAHASLAQRLVDEAAIQALGASSVMDIEDLVLDTTAAHAEPEVSPDTLAYIRYTSGSTGRPKGVMQSHRGLLEHIRAYTNSLHIGADDRLSGLASFTHDAGLMDAYGAVLNGASWCPWPLRQRSPAEAVDALESLGITIYHSTPTAFRHLFDGLPAERTLSRVRLVVFGGEAPRVSDLALCRRHFEPGCLVVNGLGSSESSQTLQAFFELNTPFERPRLPVGYPIDGTQVMLLDAEGRETDVLGEIGVRSDHVALGYWERPEQTAAVFSPEAPGQGRARLYRSGDLARRLPDGSLEWLGRIDDQLEIRGYRVEPGEVAAALAALPGVNQAVVVPRETPAGELGLVGYVVLQEDAPEPATLLQELRARLPEHMHPALLVPLDALPTTAGGKLDKRALPDPEWGEVQRTHAYRAPATASEQRLAQIFAEVLGLERVGADDHFFELGGHSLLATRIVSRVRDALHVELPLADIFAEPRLAGLAARIDALLDGEHALATPPLVVADRPANPEPSFQQLRVWFLDRLEPGSGAYNMPVARSLRGALDVDALRSSLNTLVARHETLRSSFPSGDGRPHLRIASSLELELPLEDLSALAPAEREHAVAARLKADAQAPFDLARGPLIRASLLKLAEEEHVFLLCIHHMVCDAGSIELFFRELAACYAATLEQRPAELPALAVQYADYAHWQHRCLQSHVLDDQLAWWRGTLGEGASPLELPLDRPRPEIMKSVGAREATAVNEDTVRALRRLGQEESASLFMVLLAAFNTLLMRTTGSTDVVVGTPVSGRTHTEVEPLVGFFINTLVLRNDLSGAPTFRELVRGVRQSTLDAFAHQDIPFEKLVEELKPRRDLGRNPLFDVFVNMVELSDSKGFELAGLTSEPVGEMREHSKFDITLYLLVRGDAVWLRLVYNTALFERSTVLGLLDRFNRLLDGAAKDADQPLGALPLLAADERARLAAARAPNPVTHDAPPFEAEQAQQSIAQRFARQVARAPDSAAVRAEDATWTYASLDQRSGAVAQSVLRAVAAASGDTSEPQRIVLLVESGAHALAGALGVLRAGHAYVPLDPSYPEAWLLDVFQDIRAAAVLTDHAHTPLAQLLAGATGSVIDIEGLKVDAEADAVHAEPVVSPDALAYIRYTSGSTGRPKGVMQSHRGLLEHIRAYTNSLHIGADDCLSGLASFTHDAGLMDAYGAVLNGASWCPLPLKGRAPAQAVDSLESLGITIYHSTPTAFRHLFDGLPAERTLSSVRLVVFGGEAPRVSDLALCREHFAPGCLVVNGLGSSESSQSLQAFIDPRTPFERPRLPVGHAIEGTEVVLLDTEGRETDVLGEIGVRSDHVALGYWERPGQTAAVFSPETPGQGRARLYRSGDLARRLPDGSLEWLGRIDDQLEIRGYRVEPGEVVAALTALPEVAQAAVVPRRSPTDELRLVGYVVPAEAASPLDLGALLLALRERLPEQSLPATLVQLDALPSTPGGKLDRGALPEPAWTEAQRTRVYREPVTGTEERLAEIFAGVLGLERVGADDHFFEIGGHSLLATQVVSRILSTFSVELPLAEMFEQPTVARIAACIDTVRWSRGDTEATDGAQVTTVQPAPAGVAPSLSFGQERFWFLHQLQPDSAAHILHTARHLEGAFDHEAMERALTTIVSRHAVLRCTFPESEDGEPTCVVAEPSPVAVERTDLSALGEAEQRARVEHIAAQESRTPFDIARGPLLRAHVLRLSETSHVFLFSMHHMLGDAWSMGVFWREFGALYSAESAQQASPLEDLALQYTDFAYWQRQRLGSGEGASGRLDELLGYWTEQLRAAPPLLDLPTDRPRPAIEAFAGARTTRTLDPELTSALKGCATQADVTLFMLLHAGFSELLHRYSGQTDIVLGVPVAGRLRAEFEDLIGLFVNSICLRADLSGNPTFAELLQRSRVTSLEGFAHQEMPFERLVQELRPTRALSHHPLFQVMLVLQNAPRSGAQLPGLEMRAAGTQRLTSQFDLTLFVWESGGHIALSAEYKTGLFDPATVEGMLEHLECLLRGAVAAPNRPVRELPLLSESERQRVLLEWNDTDVPLPEATTLHQLFRRQAEATPERTAVTFAGGAGEAQLTYAELSSAASRFARRLRAEGMQRGSRIGLCLDRGLPMVEALLGILEVGAAYVPLDPTHPKDRLRFVIEDAQLDGLVMQPDYLQLLDVRDVPIIFMESSVASSEKADVSPDDEPDADDLAYVIYTSGSTGRPKGVELTHRSVVNFLTSMHKRPGITEDDILLSVTTLSFDIAVLEIFGPLTIGAQVVLAPSEIASDGARLEALLSRTRATICQATPSTWRLLLEARWPGDRRLKILCGGEAWSRALADELLPRCRSLWNMYGPTETTVWSAVQQVEAGDAPVAIGPPIANTQLYVLDATDQPVPMGVPGELHIGGNGLARGYWNREELTAERFVPDLLGPTHGGRLYRTGDLVRRRADGTLDFLGRIDHQVKVQGFRIELGEIETVLGDHADINEVVVTAHEYGPDDTRLVAYIVPESGPVPSDADLREALRERLPDYMVPGIFMMLEEMPRTPNGKLDRNALPEPAPTRRADSEETVLPSTPVELTLADIWKDLLKIEEISILDNFFDLGGHSLLAMRVVARLEQETGVRINPGELILQTLGQVAAAAERSLPPQDKIGENPKQSRPAPPPAPKTPRTPSVKKETAPEPGGKLSGWARKLLGRNRSDR